MKKRSIIYFARKKFPKTLISISCSMAAIMQQFQTVVSALYKLHDQVKKLNNN